MNETLDYIESYFINGLPAEERTQFEQRIATDAAFAGEVAFYVQARQMLRQELMQQKESTWKETVGPAATKPAPVVPIRRPLLIKRWMAVAASMVIILGTSLFLLLGSNNSAGQLAQHYSDSAFEELEVYMDASRDSLQQGIAAYNTGHWEEAEKLFDAVYAAHPDTLDALKYSGIVSLKKKNYDKAVKQFGKLAGYSSLFANPGLFYQALALLLRDGKGDKQQARRLLQQVADNDLFGRDEALQLLQKLPS